MRTVGCRQKDRVDAERERVAGGSVQESPASDSSRMIFKKQSEGLETQDQLETLSTHHLTASVSAVQRANQFHFYCEVETTDVYELLLRRWLIN